MRKELVSIVIPIYNMEEQIERSLKSIVEQTYKNIEVILVDDGSTDKTYLKCLSLQNDDERIKVYHKENGGSGPARNFGIEYSNGKYIYFPDADDYIEPSTIEILVNKMEETDVDLIVFGYKNVAQNGEIQKIKKYPNEKHFGEEIRSSYSNYMTTISKYGIQGAPWNKFFKLEIIKKFNIEYPALRRHQDEGFIARYMSYVSSVLFISNILYTYYVNDLNKEWDKYPIDYIDSVEGLYKERQKNILLWNLKDKETHELVYKEYICNIIKSLELSFSPKYNFNFKARMNWIKKIIADTQIEKIQDTKYIRKYQKIILFLIKKRIFIIMYFLLKLKVFIEKNGILSKLKNI